MKQLLMRCKKFPLPTEAELQPRYVEFGENPEKKKTLVLDMDETLLHAKFAKDDDADFSFVLQSEKQRLDVNIKIRPYFDMTLDYLAKFYEICVFTAGTQEYADACLDNLDPDRQIIKHRLYR